MKLGLVRVAWTIAGAAVVLGGWSCLGDLEDIEAAEQQREKVIAEYRDLAGKALNLPLYQQQLKDLNDRFDALQGVLPWEHLLGGERMAIAADRIVHAEASRFRLHSVSVSLAALQRQGEVSTRRIDVAVSGEYRDLLAFLQAVSIASGRLWTVEYAALARRPDGRGLSMLAELKAHGNPPEDARAGSKGR